MGKRILLGNAVIISGMIIALAMTFVYSWMEDKFPKNAIRIDFIFGIGGFILASVTIISAFLIYTNNGGEGFKNKA